MRRLESSPRESKVEAAKRESRALRGTIAESLADGTAVFSKSDGEVLKFHGIYGQEDRDAREAAKASGDVRRHIFMVRVKIPGGMLSADQYLALDRLADEVVYNDSLRITTRQNIQLHGVLKGDLAKTLRRVDDALLTTFCGCGDVERNIVAPPAPLADVGHRELRRLARELTEALTPATRAYHELWLDGAQIDGSPENDPLYGAQYLPRKFKTGLALPDDNSVEVHDQDLGFIGIVEGDALVRLNVVVGGGGGLTHRKADTYARLATPLCSVDAARAVDVARAVVSMFRDYGDRSDRKHARLKYVVEANGIDAFREELRRRVNFPLHPWIPIGRLRTPDWIGAHAQGDGRYFFGVHLDNGRVVDTPSYRLKSALREAIESSRPAIVLTPSQDIFLTDLARSDVATIERTLTSHGVDNAVSGVRRRAMACPALPTCGLALAEAERISADLLRAFDLELARLELADTPPVIRITGCPNGCVRTYNGEIGIVGRKPGHYDVFVGGDAEHLGELYAEEVAFDDVVVALRPLLAAWASQRSPAESLAGFYTRRFASGARTDLLTGAKNAPAVERVTAALSAG